jgi:hypothetical protein
VASEQAPLRIQNTAGHPAQVEHFADIDTAIDEFGARFDVGDDEIELSEDPAADVNPVPKWMSRRAGGRELHDPERVALGDVGIEPPPQAAVKALGSLDVRNGDHDDFELHVEHARVRGLECRSAVRLCSGGHVFSLGLGSVAASTP